MTQQFPKNNQYIPQLTGIRCIAAYMVFLHHFNPVKKYYPGSFPDEFITEFYTGVTVFFVLSGFLIAYRYMDSFTFSLRWFLKYMKNRFARIYPMYFLLTVLTFIVLFHQQTYNTENTNGWMVFIANVTFVRGFFDDLKFTGISQGWSLTVEECFYFLAPFLFILYSRYKKLFLYPILFIVAGVVLVLIFQNQKNMDGFFDSYHFMFNYTFFGRCTEFFLGVQLAIIVKRRELQAKFTSVKFTFLGLSGMIVSLVAMTLVKGNAKFAIDTIPGIGSNNLVLPVFVCCFFYGLLFEKSWVSKFLSSKILVLLGKSSYIFYLIHQGVISAFITSFFPQKNLLNLCILFVLINLISIALYKLLESPINNSIKKISFGKRLFATTV
jgi:peptidoglycan/LPS O-acetylase OafA/YrhL